jgi:Nucleotidyl transferase AbiEii toxin, Type IV TA system
MGHVDVASKPAHDMKPGWSSRAEQRVTIFEPRLDVLPPSQLALWPELAATPDHFTLYGGTALALRLGHRISADFDFFSNQSFDPDRLAGAIPYLADAERVQVDDNTLTCRVDRRGPVLVSFFGNLGLGQVAARDQVQGLPLHVASWLDLAGTKVAVVQKRAQERDYLDIDALIRHGIDLPTALAAGRVVYGHSFNPLITLKALSYFDDVPGLRQDVRARLSAAVDAVDPTRLPALAPHRARATESGRPR